MDVIGEKDWVCGEVRWGHGGMGQRGDRYDIILTSRERRGLRVDGSVGSEGGWVGRWVKIVSNEVEMR